ncbi:MAG: peptide ABC transporter substrate-binding protein [Francisellaceae bacterium]
MLKKKLLGLMVAGSVAVMLAGCGNSAENGKSGMKSSAGSGAEYAPAGKDTFVRANGSEPESVDPAKIQTNVAASILYDLYEGLMSENQANEPIAGVAKSWKISDDGKVYTFYLRRDAKWSNGEPVTAEDFVYSLKRAVAPKTASPAARHGERNARSSRPG